MDFICFNPQKEIIFVTEMQHRCNRVATELKSNIMKINFSITKQNDIKKVLGYGYASKIALHLKNRKILNTNNVPYSTASVRLVFNNHRTNDIVVKEILKLYKKELKAQQKLQAEINDLKK